MIDVDKLPEREEPKVYHEINMTLREKLMHIQHELKAPKNLRNNFGGYNYRNAESILEALKPLLVKYKATVTITDLIMECGGRIYVNAIATIHDTETDQKLTVEAYAREAETKKGMDDAQVTGATSSYARKYALNGLFLLDDAQDVDSEAFQKAERSAQNAPKAQGNKTTPKPKAKPQEAPQSEAQPHGEPAAKDDEARVALRKVMEETGIDAAIIQTACGIGPNSTHEDYVNALAYAENLARLTESRA